MLGKKVMTVMDDGLSFMHALLMLTRKNDGVFK